MDLLQTIPGNDVKAGLLVIMNLIVIESLLSVDNAAVLATMVIDLPKEQRGRALKYGIVGAYVMRGICLLLAAWLVKIWWLKPLGGIYLIYLAIDYFKGKDVDEQKEDVAGSQERWVYRIKRGKIGAFWATVVLVEVMDLAFSIDNVFAAVAFTDNIYLICVGVFIGILAMRFVAQGFVRLIEKFPFLESVAFIVIAVLGLKLLTSLYSHFYPQTYLSHILNSEKADVFISLFTVAVFVLPIFTSLFFNFPRQKDHRIEPADRRQ